MGEGSKIEWTDHTFNPWWGCTRVSPACDHCYAATWAARWEVGWGASAAPRVFGDAHWREPLKWDAAAAKAGIRARVFCASMADVFERRDGEHSDVLDHERSKLWALIALTPHLDWLLLTKRPENVMEMIPASWSSKLPDNVWVGTTVENQEQADRRIFHLLRVPAHVRFLSCEPLLGAIDLTRWLYEPMYCRTCGYHIVYDTNPKGLPAIHTCMMGCEVTGEPGAEACSACGSTDIATPGALSWVIAGGESGPGARPSHPEWFRSLRDQCQVAGVPFFFKQWGDWLPDDHAHTLSDDAQVEILAGRGPREAGVYSAGSSGVRASVYHVGKHVAGRLLDGRAHDGAPS